MSEPVRSILGDSREVLREMDANSIDSCVTDPPYALVSIVKRFGADSAAPAKSNGATGVYARAASGFMGKTWDNGETAFDPAFWAEVLRVLKPGGHCVAFGGTRTYHRLVCAIEDGGFEIRDQLAWIFGCLDEQTQAATKEGVKPYHKIKTGDLVLCYDVASGRYSYQPVLEVMEYDYSDTAYRLVGDFGEQVVSRNHRCIIECGGAETFVLAEDAARQCEARVPVLESLPELREALSDSLARAGGSQQDVLASVHEGNDRRGQQRAEANGDARSDGSVDLRGVQEGVSPKQKTSGARRNSSLLTALQRRIAWGGVAEACSQGTRRVVASLRGGVSAALDWASQSIVEGRANLSHAQGRLRGPDDQVCALSGCVSGDGAQGWLRHGASVDRGESHRSRTDAGGIGSPHRSRRNAQRAEQPDAVRDERGAQGVRAWRGHRSAVVRIVPFHYTGKVWCLRVPTGAFVAVRNGVAFPTGNSGFPKSHDVSKGIDRARDDRAAINVVTGWLARQRDKAGLTNKDIDAAFGFAGMAGHWTASPQLKIAQCPKWDQWLRLKELIGFSEDMDAEVWRLNGRKGTPGDNWVVVGEREAGAATGGVYGTFAQRVEINDPTAAAAQWQGWGTALKPAHEPICLARKPLIGTIAANVLAHGTGALNIDASRVGTDGGTAKGSKPTGAGNGIFGAGLHGACEIVELDVGRWPANVLLDGSEEVLRGFPETQSGALPASTPRGKQENIYGARDHTLGARDIPADSGSAARFFYTAKADAGDRLESKHPTVKPVDLMAYLVKLITPPNGVVLDPFAGSGTTGMACMREGFDCILIERELEYVADIKRRIAHVHGHDAPLFVELTP